jgi:hypothetical protein
MSDDNQPLGENTGGGREDVAGTRSPNPWASMPPSGLMRRIAEESENPRLRDMAAAIVTLGTEIVLALPAIVTMATRLRQGAPHSYLPLLASWKLPARRVFLTFERDGIEHGVLAETLPGDVLALKHVRLLPSGCLQQPPASSVLDLDAQRPFVIVNELPCGPSGPETEADRIWMTWFHSIANPVYAGAGTIMEEQRRRWVHWLLNDLAILAVAFSGAVTSQLGKMDQDFRIMPGVSSDE